MRLPAALLLPLAIAACNSQGNTNQAAANASVSTSSGTPAAPAAPAAASTIQPGRWETTMRVVSLDMPGASPELQAQLRAQPIPAPQVNANCVTPEEAADMAGNFQRQMQQGGGGTSCEIGERQFGGGRIRMSMTCRAPNGGPEQRLAMVGTFSPTSVQMAVSADSSMQTGNGPQSMRIESALTARRVGECNGTETD